MISQPIDTYFETRQTDWFEPLLINDCEPDERLDCITRDAADLFDVPIAMVNVVTTDTVVFMSCVGANQGKRMKREETFCGVAATREEPLIVTDMTKDATFKNYELVTGSSHIRAYLGKALKAPDGSVIGTLCLLDKKPRIFSAKQISLLAEMATMAEEQLSAMFALRRAA